MCACGQGAIKEAAQKFTKSLQKVNFLNEYRSKLNPHLVIIMTVRVLLIDLPNCAQTVEGDILEVLLSAE